MTQYDLTCADDSFSVEVLPTGDQMRVSVSGSTYILKLKRVPGRGLLVEGISDKPTGVTVIEADRQHVELILGGERFSYHRRASPVDQRQPTLRPVPSGKGFVTAPMPGKVVGVLVKAGAEVKAGDPLVILESMKMEIAVRGDRDSEVEEILVDEGVSVKRGQALVKLRD